MGRKTQALSRNEPVLAGFAEPTVPTATDRAAVQAFRRGLRYGIWRSLMYYQETLHAPPPTFADPTAVDWLPSGHTDRTTLVDWRSGYVAGVRWGIGVLRQAQASEREFDIALAIRRTFEQGQDGLAPD